MTYAPRTSYGVLVAPCFLREGSALRCRLTLSRAASKRGPRGGRTARRKNLACSGTSWVTPLAELRARGREFGSYTLEYFENASLQSELWPSELGRERRWADNTWNRYYQMFR